MATFTIVLYSLGQWSEYVGHPDESLARKYSLTASYWMQVQGESKLVSEPDPRKIEKVVWFPDLAPSIQEGSGNQKGGSG